MSFCCRYIAGGGERYKRFLGSCAKKSAHLTVMT